MLTLEAAATFRGKAGTGSAITYTLVGDEVASGADAFKVLAQGQLGTGTTILYTVPGSTRTLIKEIHLANTTAGNITGITFYVNGTAGTNQITGIISIPANGTAVYDGKWSIYDGSGVLQFVGSTGPAPQRTSRTPAPPARASGTSPSPLVLSGGTGPASLPTAQAWMATTTCVGVVRLALDWATCTCVLVARTAWSATSSARPAPRVRRV